jgi:hypothetical protein
MEKRIILRGVLVGALGGLLAFLFARIFAEPVIGRAIDYESGRDEALDALAKAAGLPSESGGPDIFSRSIQSTIGIGFGMLLFGVAMGAIFAVVYAVAIGRVGRISPGNLAFLIAGGLFLGTYFLPFLKYPSNPPSIGHPETIRDRTGLYLLVVACTLAFLLAAIWLGRRLAGKYGNWTASVLAATAFVVAIAIVLLILPSTGQLPGNSGQFATETPQPLRDPAGAIVYPGFPADDLYAFRLYSVAAQAILWLTIGLCFAPLAGRLFGTTTRGSDSALLEPRR